MSVLALCFAEEMEAFAERGGDPYFEFSKLLFFVVLIFSAVVGVMLGAVSDWTVGLGVGVALFFALHAVLGKCTVLKLFSYTASVWLGAVG